MEITDLIESLSDPSAYPHPVDTVEIRQTHISVVFLAGPFVYKVKKALTLGFVDYGTLAKRHHYCDEEVRLNRRLAPRVYLGVVPITEFGGRLRVEGPGEAVEWAVKMERLPDEARLRDRLARDEVGLVQVQEIGRRISAFHRQAAIGPEVARYGRFEVVARNARDNFDQSAADVGITVSPEVIQRLRDRTEQSLAELQPLISSRADRGQTRDTHGDLRLDHVYLFPEHQPPEDLLIIDAIEFNEQFRFADPVSDMAFLAMDFDFLGYRALGRAFCDAYFQESGDVEGRALLPYYKAYRAAVRAKVEGIKRAEPEVPETERARMLRQARAHWLLALGTLEPPERRPCLLLVGGLPGTGKSTLARGLAERAGFVVLRSDLVRKELAAASQSPAEVSAFEAGIYAPEWTDRTYAECLRRAQEHLFEGRRVLIDASFRRESNRRDALDLATAWGVPGLLLHCQADPAVVRSRIESRRDDASDADWSIYLQAAERWEPLGSQTRSSCFEIDTSAGRDATLAHVLDALRAAELYPREAP